MELLFTVLLLNILRQFASDFAKLFVKLVNTLQYHNVNVRIKQKRRYLDELKMEQREINMMEEFAKHAKLQRKIDKVTRELKTYSECKVQSQYFLNLVLRYSFQTVLTLGIMYLCVANRSHPVLYLQEKYTSYFSVLFSFPGGQPGTVSCFFWAAACRVCVGKIVDYIKECHNPQK